MRPYAKEAGFYYRRILSCSHQIITFVKQVEAYLSHGIHCHGNASERP